MLRKSFITVVDCFVLKGKYNDNGTMVASTML